MFAEIFANWEGPVILLVTISYFELVAFLSLRYNPKKTFTDHEILANLARLMECSEYDIFGEAAKLWTISIDRVEQDFKIYLTKDQLPHYVIDFLRKFGKDVVLKKLPLLNG
jgi:hypothetical protein